MTTSDTTFGQKINDVLGNDEFKADKQALVNVRQTVGAMLGRKAVDRGNDKVKIKLSDEEKDELEGLRAEAKALVSRQDIVDAYFPYATLFLDRVAHVRARGVNAVFMARSEDDAAGAACIESVIEAMSAELRKMAMLKPLKRGEDAGDRFAAAAAKVLKDAFGVGDETDPETIIARQVFGAIDPDHPAAVVLATRAAVAAVELVNAAHTREEFALLAYVHASIGERMRTNVEQWHERNRRQAMNPGMKKGLFETMRSALDGLSGGKEPPQWKQTKKSGFRQAVADAEASS